MPAEATTLAVPVVVSDVAARTSRTVEVAVDSAVADPIPADDRARVSFDVTPAPPATDPRSDAAAGRWRTAAVGRERRPGARHAGGEARSR